MAKDTRRSGSLSDKRLPSELGYFELVGRSSTLSLRDQIIGFRDLVSADMDWADSRKGRFRRRASVLKGSILLLTAVSTAILGITTIPNRSSFALPIVAVVTALGTFEAFLNWRPRWVLMEETQYRLNRLRDDIDYYLVTTSEGALAKVQLDLFYAEQQLIWADVSRRWVQFRKVADAAPPAQREAAETDRAAPGN